MLTITVKMECDTCGAVVVNENYEGPNVIEPADIDGDWNWDDSVAATVICPDCQWERDLLIMENKQINMWAPDTIEEERL